jgi:hypothetical protein
MVCNLTKGVFFCWSIGYGNLKFAHQNGQGKNMYSTCIKAITFLLIFQYKPEQERVGESNSIFSFLETQN